MAETQGSAPRPGRHKIPAEFVPLHVDYARDRAIRNAGVTAEALYVRSLAHARLHKTGGFVADFDLSALAFGIRRAQDAVAALVREGLWLALETGWQIRTWEKWNGTTDDAAAEKAAQSAAATETNHNRWHVERGEISPTCPLCQIASDSLPIVGTESQSKKKKETKSESKTSASDVATATPPAGAADADAESTQTLIAEWIDHCDSRPPSRVIGQVSKEIKGLLSEGIAYQEVRAALAAWARKGTHPATLASIVYELRAQRAPRQSTTEARVNDALDLARRLAAEEAQPREIGA